MARPVNKSLDRIKNDTAAKEAILAAVQRLVLDGRRFTDLKIPEITAEAGVARSSFYKHFTDKKALIEKIIADFEEDMIELGHLSTDVMEMTSLETIQIGMVNIARFYRKHYGTFRAIAEVSAYDKDISRKYNGIIEKSIASRRTGHKRRSMAGTMRQDTNEEILAALTWMVERTMSKAITAKTPLAVTDDKQAMKMIEGISTVIWRTLYDVH